MRYKVNKYVRCNLSASVLVWLHQYCCEDVASCQILIKDWVGLLLKCCGVEFKFFYSEKLCPETSFVYMILLNFNRMGPLWQLIDKLHVGNSLIIVG